ncbi:MAG: ABC transporter substrate-binding protein, partial [bacterium]
GGINGHPLEVVFYDTQGSEDRAVTYAKRLITKDKVSAIIGPTRSGPSLAILDTISSAKIPLVSCAASYKIVADEEGNARKWIFKTPQSDSMAVERIYEYFNNKGIEKVAIMNVSNGYGESGRAELKRLAPNYNIEIVADDRFGQDDTDMTPQLTKVKNTDAQALVVWAVQKAPAIVAKNFKTLGMDEDMLLVQSHGVASKKFIGLCGDAADGQILPAGRLLVVDQLPEDNPQKAVLAEYKKNFEERYGPVSTFGGHAYDSLMILKKAMEKAGTDDPAKVRDALENIDKFVGTGGVFNMTPADHNGLSKDAFVMVEIVNKDWKLIAE